MSEDIHEKIFVVDLRVEPLENVRRRFKIQLIVKNLLRYRGICQRHERRKCYRYTSTDGFVVGREPYLGLSTYRELWSWICYRRRHVCGVIVP
jgi:hypothetical protein